jgi:hypothetical protein
MFGLDKISKMKFKKRGIEKIRFPSLFAEERTIREWTGCRSERTVQDVFLYAQKPFEFFWQGPLIFSENCW